QQWLGDTLEKIAAEKAGIIKPGIPVVTAADEPSALAVIEKIAREKSAPLTKINSREGWRAAVPNHKEPGSPKASPIEDLPLPGEHQKLNAALALTVVEVLQKQIPVAGPAIRAGLAGVNWPGRLQLVEKPDGQKILLDGAHNLAGVETLRVALAKDFPETRRTLVLGVLQDKDWRDICGLLAPLAAEIFIVPVASVRTAQPDELASVCRAANPAAEIVAVHSLAEAFAKIASPGRPPHPAENLVVITGSLYLVGEALELLGLSPARAGERALNEWSAKTLTAGQVHHG
ncbi:MAG: cyanophycin synthetase, partial [Verrucomicrobiota bacterium]